MFDHHSGSSGIGIFWILASFAIGASLGATRCSSAQAQPIDLSLGQGVFSTQEGQESDTRYRYAAGATPDRVHLRWVEDMESKAWPGFLTGMSGYEDFVMPVGMPMYFEDPFITTDVRLLYMHHKIPGGSALRGGQVHVAAAQIRVALSERLAFIVTKGGYSWVDSGITAAGDGWNDWALGLKYALYSRPEEQFLVSTGMRWELTNGSSDAWQGGESQEFSPFVSMAKGWDKWHFLGALSGRIPSDRHDGNASIVWNLHLDYKLTETFRPLVELHGIHYLSNADRLPLGADYLDVGSLGVSGVRGRDYYSAGFGFRWQARDNVSVGLTYEIPLESASENLQEHRVTLNAVVSF
ncbi:MAG: hypothetical protein ACE5EX_00100 [Phycisphaerae bacterium]